MEAVVGYVNENTSWLWPPADDILQTQNTVSRFMEEKFSDKEIGSSDNIVGLWRGSSIGLMLAQYDVDTTFT